MSQMMRPKESIVRSEPYRRLVAALPCRACGTHGYSQAAHVPPTGRGIKQSDLEIFPLCCVRPGVVGCHQDYDQWRMFPRDQAVEIGLRWAAETRALIKSHGMFPRKLEAA